MDIEVKKVVVGILKTNCYIITNDKAVTIIDPGDEAEKIIDYLEKKKFKDVQSILLTHAHPDHIGALEDLSKKYPTAQIYLSQKDIDFEKNTKKKSVYFTMVFPGIKTRFKPISEKEFISFGKDHFSVIETPGHTPGSLCYLINNNLFSGDTLFYRSYGITDFPGGNSDAMKESLGKLSKLPENTTVYPGHLQKTTIGEEKEFGYLT